MKKEISRWKRDSEMLEKQYCGEHCLSPRAKWHRERDIVLKGEGKSKRPTDYKDLGPCKR